MCSSTFWQLSQLMEHTWPLQPLLTQARCRDHNLNAASWVSSEAVLGELWATWATACTKACTWAGTRAGVARYLHVGRVTAPGMAACCSSGMICPAGLGPPAGWRLCG